MNYKIKHTKQVVLLFIGVPVLLLILAVVFISIQQKLFEKRYFYFTALSDANGISTQTPILFKGFEIGRIRTFNLTDSGEIDCQLYILKRYNHIMHADGVISRSSNPITGRVTLEYVNNPDSMVPLKDGSRILSTDFPDGKALFRKISPRSNDAISSIIDNVNTLTSELTKDNNADKGSLFRILTTVADVAEQTDRSMQQMNLILAELNKFSQNLNRDQNADQGSVFRILNNTADLTAKLNTQMLVMEEILLSVKRSMANLENPDSLIIRMVDPSTNYIFGPLKSTLEKVGTNLDESALLLRSLNRNNPEIILMIENLNQTLNNAKKTLEGINNNPLIRGGIKPSATPTAPQSGKIKEMPHEN